MGHQLLLQMESLSHLSQTDKQSPCPQVRDNSDSSFAVMSQVLVNIDWRQLAHQAFEHCFQYSRYLAAAGLGLFFSGMDCDMTLWFYSRFGRSPKCLAGKVVWITGSSSGIGESLAYLLSTAGCKLVLCGTRSDRLQSVRQKCHELNKDLHDGDILILQFNMKETERMPQLVNQVIDHFGRLDILVNNAGRTQRALFERTDLDVDRDLFEVNVFGLIHLTRAVVRVSSSDLSLSS